mmetsp:Transcript_53233/g.53652  ORF Transcript_53233/g.53652 Transcript_53233/m.53652 type:complete len:94 (+) Transcript_53233:54-335(+)
MKFYLLTGLVATATAFTSSPAAFTAQNKHVGDRAGSFQADSSAHRTRQATIVMDGKANGEINWPIFVHTTKLIEIFMRYNRQNRIHDVCEQGV